MKIFQIRAFWAFLGVADQSPGRETQVQKGASHFILREYVTFVMLDIVIRWVSFQLCVEYAPDTVLILLFNRVVMRDLVKRGTIYI